MPWTIPDKGEGDNDLQSILFQEDLGILIAGLTGVDCVVSGCVITGGADMTPAVAKGAVISNGTLFAVAGADVTIGAADGTNPRIDLIVVNSSGALAVRAGTAAVDPKPPVRTANDVVLAFVYVPAADTSIETTKIVDKRVIRDRHGVTLKNTTTRVTQNTLNTILTYASLTCPSGMLTTGKTLRVRCGGNYLANSGTPTWTLTISYGGTTLYAGTSAATVADADRKAWYVEFELTHTASNAQHLTGQVQFGTPGTITAPATGVNNFGLATANTNAIASATAGTTVDSDAADRDLLIRWTMSVSNAAVETVMNFATFELL